MNRIEELRNLAEAATLGVWKSREFVLGRVTHREIGAGEFETEWCARRLAEVFNKQDHLFISAANPQTILALLDLIELQHAALGATHHAECVCPRCRYVHEALTAYNKFKEQS